MKKDNNDKEPDNKALLRLKLFEEAREERPAGKAPNKTVKAENKKNGKAGKSKVSNKKK